MNSSVPLSPPLISAALTRIATTSPSMAQNSVVLMAAFVSWLRSARRPRIPFVRGVSTRVLPVAPVVAKVCSFELIVFRSHRGERVRLSLHRCFVQIAGTARRSRSVTEPGLPGARCRMTQTPQGPGLPGYDPREWQALERRNIEGERTLVNVQRTV